MDILMAAGVSSRREGGVAALIYNYGRELQARGHNVSYVFSDDLLSPQEAAGRFRDLRFAWRLARHIRNNPRKFDVVNLHAPSGLFYGISRKLSRAKNAPAPCVMTLHGLEERRIYVMSREEKKGRAWHYSLGNRIWQRLYHMPRYYVCIKTADHAHCVSREVRIILELEYNLKTERVAYIPQGVGEQFFLDRSYEDRAVLRILYAGTWLDQRGIFYIRDALISLNQKCRDWTLTIAGSGATAEQLQQFFGDELRGQILVESIVPADRMPDLYFRHDVLLLPSLMEGLPSVILEAMASGMTVVTTDICGMPDVVEDGFNGVLLPPADAAAITTAIHQLCNDTNLRAKLGSAAQETMRRHTWQCSAAKLEQVFATAAKQDARNE